MPVLGTATNTTVGGTIGGIVLGVGVDASLLKLEELNRREQFESELIAAINAARNDFKASIFDTLSF